MGRRHLVLGQASETCPSLSAQWALPTAMGWETEAGGQVPLSCAGLVLRGVPRSTPSSLPDRRGQQVSSCPQQGGGGSPAPCGSVCLLVPLLAGGTLALGTWCARLQVTSNPLDLQTLTSV